MKFLTSLSMVKVIKRLFFDFRLLLSMLGDILLGRYRRLPVRVFLCLIGAVLYIIWPMDLIIDVIPGLGQVDDLLILFGAIYYMEKDLMEYAEWKISQEGK